MVRVNKPMEGEAKFWEHIIENSDHNTFFQSSVSNDTDDKETEIHGTNPMPKNHLKFVYGYTVCCGGRKKLITWLSTNELQASTKHHVFKKITPSDEAWTVANVVNQYDGWCKKFEKANEKTHPIHKKSLGKWISLMKDLTE